MITVSRAALATELGYLRSVTRDPIRFLFDADHLQLSAQGEARLSTSLEANGQGDAWLCVNELYEWLRLVDAPEVGLRFTQHAAVFSHETGAIKVPTLMIAPSGYPASPVVAELRMPCQAAQEMLRAVEMAQPDGYHAYIDGLLFESTSNVFTVGAFNGILLGAAESSQPSLDFRTVLAESAVKYLHRTIREGADELVLRLHERAVSFLCGPRETIVPMAAGTRFPAFRKFMPKGTYRMDARLEDIRSALTAVITPARDVHAVALAPSAGDLRFSVGESSAVISCFGALPEMKVSAEDLRAIMRSLETERVEFLCDGPTSPLAIRPMSGRTAVYLMSPTTK